MGLQRHVVRRRAALAAQAVALAAAGSLAAQALAWDPNGAAPGLGGNGSWSLASSFWNTDLSGGGGGTLLPWTNAGAGALFGGGASTVTLGSSVSARSLDFQAPYLLTGLSLTLVPTGASTLGPAEVHVASGVSARIDSRLLANAAGFTKTGPGELTLGGASNSVFSGVIQNFHSGFAARRVHLADGTTTAAANNVFGSHAGYTNLPAGGATAGLFLGDGATLNAGAFTQQVTGFSGAGTILLSGGTLTSTYYAPLALVPQQYNFTGTLGGSGNVHVNAFPQTTQRLAGVNSFLGDLRVTNGILAVDSDAAMGNPANQIRLDGFLGYLDGDFRNLVAKLQTTASFATSRQVRFVQDASSHAAISEAGVGQIDIGGLDDSVTNAFTGVMSSASSNFQGFEKTGRGTMEMTAVNAYRGYTLVSDGTLVLRGQGSLNNGAGIDGALIAVAGGRLVLDNTQTNRSSRLQDFASLLMLGGETVFRGNAGGSDEVVGEVFLGTETINTLSVAPHALGGATLTGLELTRRVDHDNDPSTPLVFNNSQLLVRGRNLGKADPFTPDTANVTFLLPPELVGGGAAGTPGVGVIPLAWGDDRSETGSGNGLLAYDETRGVRLLDRHSEFSPVYPAGSTSDNVRVSGTLGNLTTDAAVKTLLLSDGTLSGTGSLRTNASGVWASGQSAIDLARLDLGANGRGLIVGVDADSTLALEGALRHVVTGGQIFTAAVTKAGDGTLRFNGYNAAFTPPFVVSGGTVKVGPAGNLAGPLWRPSSMLFIDPGTIIDLQDSPRPVLFGLNGAGGAVRFGDHTLTLLNSSSFFVDEANFRGELEGGPNAGVHFTTFTNVDLTESRYEGKFLYGGPTRIDGAARVILSHNATIPPGNVSPVTIIGDGRTPILAQTRLTLDNRTINLADRIPDAAPVRLHGGMLSVLANNDPGAATYERIDSLTISGAVHIDLGLAAHDAASAELSLGELRREHNAVLHLGPQKMGTRVGGNDYNLKIDGGLPTIADPLGPVGGQNTGVIPFVAAGNYFNTLGASTVMPNNLATYDASFGVRPLDPFSSEQAALRGNGQSYLPHVNNRFRGSETTAAQPASLFGTVRVNSLIFDSPTGISGNVAINGSGTLSIYSGAVAAFARLNVASTIAIDFGENTGYLHLGGDSTFNGPITGSAGVVFTGHQTTQHGTVRLQGSPKPFTGGLYVLGSRMEVGFSDDLQLGAPGEPVILGGGALAVGDTGVTQAYAMDRPLILTEAGGHLDITTAGSAFTLSGANSSIGGEGGLTLRGNTGGQGLPAETTATFNPATGQFPGALYAEGVRVVLVRSNLLNPDHPMTLFYNPGGASARLELRGTTQTVGGLFLAVSSIESGTPLLLNSSVGTGTLVLNGDLHFSYIAPRTQVVPSSVHLDLNGGQRIFEIESWDPSQPNLQGDLRVNAVISNGGLIKEDQGLLTLAAANTFDGGTEIRTGGVLLTGGADRLNPDGALRIARAGRLALDGVSQTVAALNGTGIVENVGAAQAVLTVDSTGSDEFGGLLRSNLSLRKAGPGLLVLSARNTYTGATRVEGGRLRLAESFESPALFEVVNAATAELAPGGSWLLRVPTLSIAFGATLDLADGRLIVDYSGPSPIDALIDDLAAAYAGGAWSGAGLTSTALLPGEALGYAESAALLGPGGGAWRGSAVDGSALLVGVAFEGDANLDGRVDVADLGALATHWQAGAVWTGGDFTYDRVVNVSDLGALASNWQAGVTGPLDPAATLHAALERVGLAVVPEPGVASLALLAFGVLAARRRAAGVAE